MKALFLKTCLFVSCLSLLFTGCKSTSIPSVDAVYMTSYTVGTSAAMVMNMTSISEKDRAIIINIANIIDESVPQTNVTFEVSWTPIATAHVNELVTKGSIDESEGQIILSLFKTATKTLDYIVFKRYPTVGQNIELVSAITHGFVSGFLTNYKVSNTTTSATTFSTTTPVVYDVEAYNYMKSQLNK